MVNARGSESRPAGFRLTRAQLAPFRPIYTGSHRLGRTTMNKLPIEQAHDRDLRLSQVAMQRAAQRAHELARATGTTIVVSHDGVIEHLKPTSQEISIPE